MAKKRGLSPVPLYVVAAIWLVWTWLLPLYAAWHYVLLIVVAVLAYGISAAICNNTEGVEPKEPDKPEPAPAPEPEPVKPERKSTGDPALDGILLDRDRAVSEMRRLNDNIQDGKLSAQIDDLELTTTKIVDRVLLHPEKKRDIRRFMNYYLPTTLKLLNTYDRMGTEGVEGENIDATMRKVEKTMDTIVAAFHKQLDALYADEALDISTDITVMENMLRREGLFEEASPFESGQKPENTETQQ